VDGINVTGGWHERNSEITMSVPQGICLFSSRIKKVVDVPVIASIRMTDPVFAEGDRGRKADLVAIGEAIADPEPKKAWEEGAMRFENASPAVRVVSK
jgi:2,4-dienoyl-CoA reductase-like NADH-dependent reductase (Old Yellow Enzyme family)